MRAFRQLWRRLRGLASREDEGFDDEIEAHLALLAQRFSVDGGGGARGGP